jgi:hypothetical protein
MYNVCCVGLNIVYTLTGQVYAICQEATDHYLHCPNLNGTTYSTQSYPNIPPSNVDQWSYRIPPRL